MLGDIAISLVTSLVTVTLAFWKFTSEKKWEIKANAYKKIMKSLHHLQSANIFFSTIYLESLTEPNEDDEYVHFEDESVTKKKATNHIQNINQASDSLNQLLNVEGVFLGKEITDILKELIDEYNSVHKQENIEVTEENVLYEIRAKSIKTAIDKIHKWAEKNFSSWWDFLKKYYLGRDKQGNEKIP